MTESCKFAFKKSFAGGGSTHFSTADHVPLCGLRLLELSRLLQRIMGLRYAMLPAPKTVIVDILKQGEFVEPVVVTTDLSAFDNNERKHANRLGAIIVRDSSGESRLLLPPLSSLSSLSSLRENARLAMKGTRSNQQATLGRLHSVTKDFFLFRLALAETRFPPPAGPAPPPAIPRA